MRWLRKLFGDDDGPDLMLRLPVLRKADPPLFCAMPEEPWRERRTDERLCGRIRSPYRPTCRRQSCVEAYAAALEEAAGEDAARREAEERRRKRSAKREAEADEGRVVAMRRARG